MTLDVYFGNKLAGFLQSTDNRGIVFYYEEKYIADKNAVPLSASLPLRKEEFSQIEAIPFFSGLLPDCFFCFLQSKINHGSDQPVYHQMLNIQKKTEKNWKII